MKLSDLPLVPTPECPMCGDWTDLAGKPLRSVALGAELLAALRAEGKIPKDSYPRGLQLEVPLMEAIQCGVLSTTPTIPVIQIGFDICECGIIYCTGLSLRQQAVEMRFMPGPKLPKK